MDCSTASAIIFQERIKRAMSKNLVCLAEGQVFPTDPAVTGINGNVLVTGATGCGKTVSYSEARLLNTYEGSLVIPLAKSKLKKQYSKIFKERGYEIIDIDFNKPDKCNMGYDPLDFVRTDEDIMNLANQLANFGNADHEGKEVDPYWAESAANVIAAVIHVLRLNHKDGGKEYGFADVLKFLHGVRSVDGRDGYHTNMDLVFEEAEKKHPGNIATRLWKTVEGNAPKTAGCIMAMMYASVDKLFSDRVMAMTQKKKRVSFKNLGKKKTIMFITTSPMNSSLKGLVNMMYSDLFKEMFEAAEAREAGCLEIPVHVICDDFACGSKINDFASYISIFRAAGISVSLLLQSESQLNSMYGENAATTIINNCDTCLYMGGTDITTCKNIAQRINKPLDWVMAMPLEQVLVFRRGSRPVVSRRYQTYSDPQYIKFFTNKGVENER